MADHFRPWKQVQREFHRIEDAKLQARRRRSSRSRRTKYQAQIDRDRRQDPPGRGPGRTQNASRDPPGRGPRSEARRRSVREARHRPEVPEGRARQPAQPLRRHDRPRREARGPASTSTDDRPPSEQDCSRLTRSFEKADAELKQPQAKKAETSTGNIERAQEEARGPDPRRRPRPAAIEQKEYGSTSAGHARWPPRPARHRPDARRRRSSRSACPS